MVAMVTSSWSKSQGINNCIEVSFHTCNYIYMYRFTRPITPPITQVIVGLNVDSRGATDPSAVYFHVENGLRLTKVCLYKEAWYNNGWHDNPYINTIVPKIYSFKVINMSLNWLDIIGGGHHVMPRVNDWRVKSTLISSFLLQCIKCVEMFA